MPRFTVDTHLFRELGKLLVGRDSTALIELIKNSYDADATEVIVHGENLDDPERGRIVVMDTGCGMTREQFIAGFLRVASRLKEQGARRSTVFGRRYTGVKANSSRRSGKRSWDGVIPARSGGARLKSAVYATCWSGSKES